MKLEITGTPAFVIDGKMYQGTIPADILKKIIQ
jgi:protein-disulfide isomerase